MGIFNFFKNKKTGQPIPRGFFSVRVKEKFFLTDISVKLSFEIPEEMKSDFQFIPGQYINLSTRLNGQEIRRSYSLCNGPEEDLAVGIKQQKEGAFSSFVLEKIQPGDEILISKPMGNFQWKSSSKIIVAFAAGSGVTPILSIAKKAEQANQRMLLFYGNKRWDTAMFIDELEAMKNVEVLHFLSQQERENCFHGRMTQENMLAVLKQHPDGLNGDDYYLCGPEDLIQNAREILSQSSISEEKIHFEMFKSKKTDVLDNTVGKKTHQQVQTTVIIDQEEFHFTMDSQENVLQKALDNDVDAPYSCRGGVCQTCRCKIIEGSAEMNVNYTLTEKEIAQGYLLSCQAKPTSDKLIVSFDE